MTFGEIDVSEAAGAVLAHSVRSGPVNFKKGRLLSQDDVSALFPTRTGRRMSRPRERNREPKPCDLSIARPNTGNSLRASTAAASARPLKVNCWVIRLYPPNRR